LRRFHLPLAVHPCLNSFPAQVWDFNRSAEMRDTEGGASKRSVLEQVAKLRGYLQESA
jgi:argininosuccinate lyase